MALNEINLEQINRRLAGGASHQAFGGYSPTDNDGWEDIEVSQATRKSSGSGFMLLLLGVFLAAGTGSYFFLDGSLGSFDLPFWR